MLTEEERREIEAELKRYPQKRAAVVESLKIVQRRRGWISGSALKDIAPLLNMTDDELESVGSSYNFIFRKPVGRHVIIVCDSITVNKGFETSTAGTHEAHAAKGEQSPLACFSLLWEVV